MLTSIRWRQWKGGACLMIEVVIWSDIV